MAFNIYIGNSLKVQWLEFHTLGAWVPSMQGTKTPQAKQLNPKGNLHRFIEIKVDVCVLVNVNIFPSSAH